MGMRKAFTMVELMVVIAIIIIVIGILVGSLSFLEGQRDALVTT
jgi:type II secretory pathway pseudopilin PulG